MNWFYAQNGQQVGPVDEGELDGLVQRGAITASTLVWRNGLATWQPYAQVKPTGAPLTATPAYSRSGFAANEPVLPGQARCTECSQVFPEDEVVRLGAGVVCAGCKPIALQKLREGTLLTNHLAYAGFWIRFAAILLDGLIMLPVYAVFFIGVYYLDPAVIFNPAGAANPLLRWSIQIFSLVFSATYEIFFITRYGATPGKMICNLRVICADGSKVGFGRATGRHFSRIIDNATILIGYLIAGFDGEKRALHDFICDTRVIYKD